MSKKYYILFTLLCSLVLVSCSSGSLDGYINYAPEMGGIYEYYDEESGETYSAIDEQGFIDTSLVSSSYLS